MDIEKKTRIYYIKKYYNEKKNNNKNKKKKKYRISKHNINIIKLSKKNI